MKENLRGKITNIAITKLAGKAKILNISVAIGKEEKFIPVKIANKYKKDADYLTQNFETGLVMNMEYTLVDSNKSKKISGIIKGEGIEYKVHFYRSKIRPDQYIFYEIELLDKKCS